METATFRLLDSILFSGLRAAEAASVAHPEKGRNFRMIMAMLWSARDELDLAREAPPGLPVRQRSVADPLSAA